jgi:hypothetical protein
MFPKGKLPYDPLRSAEPANQIDIMSTPRFFNVSFDLWYKNIVYCSRPSIGTKALRLRYCKSKTRDNLSIKLSPQSLL